MPNLDPAVLLSRQTLSLTTMHCLTLHGNLLLALRHPQNTGESREYAEDGAALLGRILVAAGVLSGDELRQVFYREAAEGGMTWADFEAASARADATAAALRQVQGDAPGVSTLQLTSAERKALGMALSQLMAACGGEVRCDGEPVRLPDLLGRIGPG